MSDEKGLLHSLFLKRQEIESQQKLIDQQAAEIERLLEVITKIEWDSAVRQRNELKVENEVMQKEILKEKRRAEKAETEQWRRAEARAVQAEALLELAVKALERVAEVELKDYPELGRFIRMRVTTTLEEIKRISTEGVSQ